MRKCCLLASVIGLALVGRGAARAEEAPPSGTKAPEPKITELRICPVMNVPVKGKGAGTVMYGNYKVYLCCGVCKSKFARMTDAEKEKAVAAAAAKQAADEPAKVTEITICPLTLHAANAKGASTTVDNYKVYYCCGGCKT